MSQENNMSIPATTVVRLSIYQRVLTEIKAKEAIISSEELAELSGVNAAQVRRDISYLELQGTPGVGYIVEELLAVVSRGLGLSRDWLLVIVGIGNLGEALANYLGFKERGFTVAALVDSDPLKIGKKCGDLTIQSIDDLEDIVKAKKISIGVLSVPAGVAQKVVNHMVDSGIPSILNFAPTFIKVPEGVTLRQVDLSVELQVLSFYLEQQALTNLD